MGFGKSKFRNKKAHYDGHTFDSQVEMRRYKSLLMLEEMGRISDLELQPHFALEGKNGPLINKRTNRRVGTYTADFAYTELGANGQPLGRVVEDVKSDITAKQPDYIIRIALLRDNFPDLDFREIKRNDVNKGVD